MKLKQKKNSAETASINREQEFLPIEKIEYGFIKQRDGKYVKILEVEPCEYINSTPDKQWEMVEAYKTLFESKNTSLHIKVKSNYEDVSPFFENVQNEQAEDPNKFIQERKKDYIETTKAFVSSTVRKQCYYFIFSYEGNAKTENDIYEKFDLEVNQYIETLRSIGCNVVERSYRENDHAIETLYTCLNPKSSLKESIDERHARISDDYEKYNIVHSSASEIKMPDYTDLIAPRGIDFTFHTQYMIIDGVFKTFLVLRGNSIPQQLASNFIDNLAQEDCEIDIFTTRIPTNRVLSSMKTGEKTKLITSTAKDGDVDTSKEEEDINYYSTLNYIRRALLDEEHYYEVVIVLSFMDENLKALSTKIDNFKSKYEKVMALHFRETYCNAEELFLMTLPLMYYKENGEIFKLNSRGFLTSSFVSLMPFGSKDFKDISGTIWGINIATQGLFAVNPANRNMGFDNMNIAFVGGSGAGKSFFQMLLGTRFYLNGFRTFYVCPLKGHEYQWFAKSVNGTFINLLPQMDCINIFEVRPEITNRLAKETALIAKKVTQIITFLKLSMPSMTEDEQGHLNIALMGLYSSFGITTDNNSIYNEDGTIKTMPTFTDLKNYLINYPDLKRVRDHIERYISGYWSNLDGQTNVDLTNNCIVINCDENEMEREYLPAIMYLAIMSLYDIIKSTGKKNDILNIDEVWKCLKDKAVAEQIEEMARVIRGYQGGLFVATQDIKAFLKDDTGSTILNLCETKILKKMKGGINDETSEVCVACNSLSLPKRIYVPILTGLTQKEALIKLPTQEARVFIYSSYSERTIYGTDDKTLIRREYLEKKKHWGTDTFEVTYEDMEDMIKAGVATAKDLE